MKSNVTATQEIVDLILDSNRNSLLTLDLKAGIFAVLLTAVSRPSSQVSIMTMGIGSGALIAGLFGMNVRRTLRSAGALIFHTAVDQSCGD